MPEQCNFRLATKPGLSALRQQGHFLSGGLIASRWSN
jgi:hypothetical protein